MAQFGFSESLSHSLGEMTMPDNKQSFTPGPWEAVDRPGAGWGVRRKHERPGYTGLAPICSMAWFQFAIPGIIDDEISGANAKLIAAAPELLEYAEAVLSLLESQGVDTGMGGPPSDLRDAIAKAKGAE